MKMMQGAFFLPCSNRSRTRLAPTPTNISTKSEPEMEKNGTLASPATARASRVLPVPGGPTSNTPFGNASAQLLELLRLAQEFDDLLQLFFGFIDAGHVLERDLLLLHGEQPRPALAERQSLVPAGLHLPDHEKPQAASRISGAHVPSNWSGQLPLVMSRTFMVTPLSRSVLIMSG